MKTGVIPQAPLGYGSLIGVVSFPALDSGYGFIIANSTITTNTKNVTSNQLPMTIYISLTYPNKDKTVGPFLLYQTFDTTTQFNLVVCNSALTSPGYICVLNLSKVEKNKKLNW